VCNYFGESDIEAAKKRNQVSFLILREPQQTTTMMMMVMMKTIENVTGKSFLFFEHLSNSGKKLKL